MLKNIKSKIKKHKEISSYIVFGVLTTAVSFLTYFSARFILTEIGIEETLIPNVISWILAVTFAYVTNRIFVFKSRVKGFWLIVKEAASFYAARAVTLLIDVGTMFLLVDLTGIDNYIYELFIKGAASAVVLATNYVLSKLIVFKKK